MTDACYVAIADTFGAASQATAWLAARLGPGLSIETHSGTFDVAALKAFGAAAPAVRVAVMGFGTPIFIGSGQADVPVKIAAGVVTVSKAGLAADRAANALATAVALAIGDEMVGVSNGFPVTEVRAENMYSGRLQEMAGSLALWQVTWTQRIRFGAEMDDASGLSAAAAAAVKLVDLVVYGTDAPAEGRGFTAPAPSGGTP